MSDIFSADVFWEGFLLHFVHQFVLKGLNNYDGGRGGKGG